MSRHGPQANSIRPRIAGQRLTARQRRALLVVADAKFVDDYQLSLLIGSYARNVIKALEARRLIRESVSDGGAVHSWKLTAAGRKILPAVRQFADGQ